MSRAADLLADHWARTKGQRKSLTLTLGDRELVVWWSPWTLAQQDFVYHDYVAGESFRPERFARVVLKKAEDAEGNRLFADAEMMDLLHRMDPGIVKTLALAILTNLEADNAAAKAAAGDDPKAAAAAATPTT